MSYSISNFSLVLRTLILLGYWFLPVHVYIHNIYSRKVSSRIYLISCFHMTLVILWWDLIFFSLQLISDMNLRLLFWFLNLCDCRVDLSSTTTPRVIEFWYGKRIYILILYNCCITSHRINTHCVMNWIDPHKLYRWVCVYFYYTELQEWVYLLLLPIV